MRETSFYHNIANPNMKMEKLQHIITYNVILKEKNVIAVDDKKKKSCLVHNQAIYNSPNSTGQSAFITHGSGSALISLRSHLL